MVDPSFCFIRFTLHTCVLIYSDMRRTCILAVFVASLLSNVDATVVNSAVGATKKLVLDAESVVQPTTTDGQMMRFKGSLVSEMQHPPTDIKHAHNLANLIQDQSSPLTAQQRTDIFEQTAVEQGYVSIVGRT